MFHFDYNTLNDFVSPKSHDTWTGLAKTGGIFILIGMLILILKELLVAILAMGFFGVGILILSLAFRIWYHQRSNTY